MKPSEWLYLFVGWLSAREECLEIGHKSDMAPLPPLVTEFLALYNLEEPRGDWYKHIPERKSA